jgi:ferrochelatase
MTATSVLLISHGTVDDLAELPDFVKNIRRGAPPPPELVAELRHRYEAIGGSSPLTRITARVAEKLSHELGLPVKTSARLWRPYPRDVLPTLPAGTVVVLALAQHSAKVYEDAVRAASREVTPSTTIVAVPNWGREPTLLDAFAARIRALVAPWSEADRAETALVLSAHSLPKAIVDAGDPYEREARAAAEGVAERVRDLLPDARIAFQSQGLSSGPGGRPMPWLGPDLPTTFDAIRADGRRRVVVAPIGFLADHVEILYDVDIEAKALAAARGLELVRAPSLNDGDDFVAVLAMLVRRVLAEGAPR